MTAANDISAAPPSRTYSRRSRHGRVAYEIGRRILRGDWQPGTTLPTEAELDPTWRLAARLREAIRC